MKEPAIRAVMALALSCLCPAARAAGSASGPSSGKMISQASPSAEARAAWSAALQGLPRQMSGDLGYLGFVSRLPRAYSGNPEAFQKLKPEEQLRLIREAVALTGRQTEAEFAAFKALVARDASIPAPDLARRLLTLRENSSYLSPASRIGPGSWGIQIPASLRIHPGPPLGWTGSSMEGPGKMKAISSSEVRS